jgi:flagellar motor switch protein FliM
LPIHKIEGFEVGQVLHLPGTTVGSVNLKGPDGAHVATAQLGQVAGKRAVRIEPVKVEMQETDPVFAPDSAGDPMAPIDSAAVTADQIQPSPSETGLIESSS